MVRAKMSSKVMPIVHGGPPLDVAGFYGQILETGDKGNARHCALGNSGLGADLSVAETAEI
ncbi:hypothetical protein ACFLST_00760 [Chloroflexota bacterium]